MFKPNNLHNSFKQNTEYTAKQKETKGDDVVAVRRGLSHRLGDSVAMHDHLSFSGCAPKRLTALSLICASTLSYKRIASSTDSQLLPLTFRGSNFHFWRFLNAGDMQGVMLLPEPTS